MILFSVALAAVLAFGWPAAAAPAVDVSGAWSLTLGADDLQAGAGSGLNSTYESGNSQAAVTVSDTTDPLDTWRLDVSRTDAAWDSRLTLSVRRTGDGTGQGALSGGTGYHEIGLMDSTFFSGAGDRLSVPLQLKLTGVSLQIPPGAYSTTVTYTVVDTQ
jgi:hypothetical protein